MHFLMFFAESPFLCLLLRFSFSSFSSLLQVKLPLVEEPISPFEFLRVALLIFVGGMIQMAAVARLAARRCGFGPGAEPFCWTNADR